MCDSLAERTETADDVFLIILTIKHSKTMRCSNCGKETPFSGKVCHWCNNNKSKDQETHMKIGCIAIIIVFIIFLFFKCSCNESKSTNLDPIENQATNESQENSNYQQVYEPTVEQTEVTETADNENITTAQKLATIDYDSPETIDINDYRVIEFQKHLYRISKAFNEQEDRIGEITYKTSLMFKTKKGLNYSTLDLLKVADKDLDTYKDSGIKYEEFMAMIYAMSEE